MISKRIKREFLNYCYRLCAALSALTNYKMSKKKIVPGRVRTLISAKMTVQCKLRQFAKEQDITYNYHLLSVT